MQIDWAGERDAENIEQFLFSCPSCCVGLTDLNQKRIASDARGAERNGR